MDETEEPPKKLTPTQMLKKRMQQEEEKTNTVRTEGDQLGGNVYYFLNLDTNVLND